MEGNLKAKVEFNLAIIHVILSYCCVFKKPSFHGSQTVSRKLRHVLAGKGALVVVVVVLVDELVVVVKKLVVEGGFVLVLDVVGGGGGGGGGLVVVVVMEVDGINDVVF